MWSSETKLSDFPAGWSRPRVVLQDDIFEASHTYCLKKQNKFLTVIEAQASVTGLKGAGRRYYKAYVADRLEGPWKTLAVTYRNPFAGPANAREIARHWTDSFSHGELLRENFDQTLVVDPARLRFLFQGVSDEEQAGKPYGEIRWRLGLLKSVLNSLKTPTENPIRRVKTDLI